MLENYIFFHKVVLPELHVHFVPANVPVYMYMYYTSMLHNYVIIYNTRSFQAEVSRTLWQTPKQTQLVTENYVNK